MKYPIYLPSKAMFTKLIIMEEHLNSHHSGIDTTLASIRQNYWFCQGRRVVKNALFGNKNFRCQTCIRDKLKPYTQIIMPHLPTQRVTQNRPFTNIGIDYFGPVKVKDRSDPQKIWIRLFSCMATRAIHLEVVSDASAEILVFNIPPRMFNAAKVPPRMFRYPDNRG